MLGNISHERQACLGGEGEREKEAVLDAPSRFPLHSLRNRWLGARCSQTQTLETVIIECLADKVLKDRFNFYIQLGWQQSFDDFMQCNDE